MTTSKNSERNRFFALAAIGGAGLATAALGQSGPRPVETPGLTRQDMVRAALAEYPGSDVVGFSGLFEPGATPGPHRHPGTELLYVIEGHGLLLQEGREPVTLEPGVTIISEPAERGGSFVHEVRNLSQTQPLRTYVVLLLDHGEPPSLPAG